MQDFRELMMEDYEEGEARLTLASGFDHFVPRLYSALVSPSGVELSIQSSFMHYCAPKETMNIMDYTSFEIACFVSEDSADFALLSDVTGVDDLEEYLTNEVYAYVPLAKVQALCEKLGIVG